jgi:archaellum component FlaF (FlaF/FlaG flagellin family)
MGFSVTLSSAILFIGLIAFGSTISGVMLYSVTNIFPEVNSYVERQRDILDVRIEMEIESISNRSCVIDVVNFGSRTIFLEEGQSYRNTMVVSYGGPEWSPFLIEDYTILEVRVTGTNSTFNASSHMYVNPGEEAGIELNLPSSAPDIPLNATVIVVFASHYGVSAQAEGIR